MKYIDAEKLIAEIERRIESWTIRGKNTPAGQGKDTCESRVTELSDLLSFITSLQQDHIADVSKMVESEHIADVSKMMEQQEVDLQKEINKEWEKCNPIDEGMGVETAYVHIEAFDMIAHHFYELGRNARKEE